MLRTFLKTPVHSSAVDGYEIRCCTGIKPDANHIALAHNRFIKAEVVATGANQTYPGTGDMTFFFFFIEETDKSMGLYYSEKVPGEGAVYISLPKNETVTKVELVEHGDRTNFHGIALTFWTKNSEEVLFRSLLIVPTKKNQADQS